MKKLLLISPGALPIPDVKGGAVENLIELFIEGNEEKHDFDITLLTIADKEAMEKQKEFKYCDFVNFNDGQPLFTRIFNKLIRIMRASLKIQAKTRKNKYISFCEKYLVENDFDVILVENCYNVLSSFDMSKCQGKKFYHIHYNDINRDVINQEKVNLENKLRNYVNIIAVSDFIKDMIDGSIACHNCITVDNAVDIKALQNIDEERFQAVRAQLEIKTNENVVVYVGRLVPEKGVKELIQAVNLLKDKDIKLVIVGGCASSCNTVIPYVQELYDMTRGRNIVFTGYVSHNEIKYYYANAKITVVPTNTVEEAAPLTAIEAMACGNLLVASDSGNLSNYIDNNKYIAERGETFVENIASAIHKALQSNDENKQEIERNLIRAKAYNKDIYYNRFVELLSK